MALECFSHRMCRTLTAVAAFRPPLPWTSMSLYGIDIANNILWIASRRPRSSSQSPFPLSQRRRSSCPCRWSPANQCAGNTKLSHGVDIAQNFGYSPHRQTNLFPIAMADKITRIAIVDSNRCKPKRCAQECKKARYLICCGDDL